MSAFSPLTQSYMDLESHPGALVGSLLHLRHYRSQQVDQRVPGWGAGILQNSTKLHSHTHSALLGLDWQRLESDTNSREPLRLIGESWKLPFDVIGTLSRNRSL